MAQFRRQRLPSGNAPARLERCPRNQPPRPWRGLAQGGWWRMLTVPAPSGLRPGHGTRQCREIFRGRAECGRRSFGSPGWGGILCHPQARSRGEAGPANCTSWLALWGHGLVELCSGPRRALTVLPGAVPRGLRSGTPLSIPANGIYSPQTTPETQTDSLSEPRGRISASPRSQTLLIGSLSVKPAARAPSTSLVHLRSGFAKRLVSGVSICFRKIIR